LEYGIPFNSETRTFDEVFWRLNIEKYLVAEKDPRGRTGYNPINMLKLVLFCQMENITSLREMAKAAQNDIRIMWLTDETKPSHNAIKEFMDKYLTHSIDEIFKDLNILIIREENIDTSVIFIDGTKIEANANKYKFVWKGSIENSTLSYKKK